MVCQPQSGLPVSKNIPTPMFLQTMPFKITMGLLEDNQRGYFTHNDIVPLESHNRKEHKGKGTQNGSDLGLGPTKSRGSNEVQQRLSCHDTHNPTLLGKESSGSYDIIGKKSPASQLMPFLYFSTDIRWGWHKGEGGGRPLLITGKGYSVTSEHWGNDPLWRQTMLIV